MTKSPEHYLALNYPIELQRNEEGGFFASHPDLDGCAALGRTADEAVSNLEDARHLWITTRIKDGLTVPEPQTQEYSGKLSLRMSPTLHGSLARLAKRCDISLNLLMNEILSEYVGSARFVFAELERFQQIERRCRKSRPGYRRT